MEITRYSKRIMKARKERINELEDKTIQSTQSENIGNTQAPPKKQKPNQNKNRHFVCLLALVPKQ